MIMAIPPAAGKENLSINVSCYKRITIFMIIDRHHSFVYR